jgi:hypothetical protein
VERMEFNTLTEENIQNELTSAWSKAKDLINLRLDTLGVKLDLNEIIKESKEDFIYKCEVILKHATNSLLEEKEINKTNEYCKWILDFIFLNPFVPETIEGGKYTVPHEFWNTNLGTAIKEVLYPEKNKNERYEPISVKDASEMLKISTVTVQKIAAEKFEGKKISSGWVLNKNKVLEYLDDPTPYLDEDGEDVDLEIHYCISSSRINSKLIETGKLIEANKTFKLKMSSISPEIRERLLNAAQKSNSIIEEIRSNFKLTGIEAHCQHDYDDLPFGETFFLDKNTNIIDDKLNYENVEEYLNSLLIFNDEKMKQNRTKSETELYLEFYNEKIKWIEEQGSNRLKKANALGYEVDYEYTKERSSKEFPDFELITQNPIEWSYDNGSRERNEIQAYPTEKALDEIINIKHNKNYKSYYDVKTYINYEITRGGYDGEEIYEKKVGEIIVIEGYLMNYYLVKKINDDDLPF